MLNSTTILKYLPWGILLITLNSHGQTLELGNTTFWWVIQFFILLVFWVIKTKYVSKQDAQQLFILHIYIIYVGFSFLRGAVIAEGYWDWKSLTTNTMSLLVPMAAYVSTSNVLFERINRHYIFYTAPLFLIVQFFIGKDEFGFYLAPFSFFLLFLPILSNKWKLICLTITAYVILADFGARSNIIKFLVPIIISLLYYFRKLVSVKLFEFVRLLLIMLPFVLFNLGVLGIFNVFKPNGDKHTALIDKKRDFQGNLVEDDLLADTRTLLYVDVLSSAQKFNSWVIGRSPARGNFSESYGENDLTKRGERAGNEVSILNYFTWLGIVGVGLIFILFYRASYLAINKSNNIISKLLGLFIAFRWAYGWVEDENKFNVQYVFLWLFIGLCYSNYFRQLTDKEVKNWINSIFKFKKNTKPNFVPTYLSNKF